ncbi:MAG: hypothetical protein AVDCRST_MAG22-21, partial [uncultured Rubrobacteraceae bacterium]
GRCRWHRTDERVQPGLPALLPAHAHAAAPLRGAGRDHPGQPGGWFGQPRGRGERGAPGVPGDAGALPREGGQDGHHLQRLQPGHAHGRGARGVPLRRALLRLPHQRGDGRVQGRGRVGDGDRRAGALPASRHLHLRRGGDDEHQLRADGGGGAVRLRAGLRPARQRLPARRGRGVHALLRRVLGGVRQPLRRRARRRLQRAAGQRDHGSGDLQGEPVRAAQHPGAAGGHDLPLPLLAGGGRYDRAPRGPGEERLGGARVREVPPPAAGVRALPLRRELRRGLREPPGAARQAGRAGRVLSRGARRGRGDRAYPGDAPLHVERPRGRAEGGQRLHDRHQGRREPPGV